MNNLNIFATQLDEFLEGQNQKLKASLSFIDDNLDFYSDTWRIMQPGERESTLDFSEFDKQYLNANSDTYIELGEKKEKIHLDTKTIAKIYVMNNITLKSSNNARIALLFVKHIFAFLVFRNEKSLSQHNIKEFHSFFLTQSVDDGKISSRLSPMTYGSSYGKHNLQQVQMRLSRLGIKGFLSGISKKINSKALNHVCKALLNITLNEFKKDGSYNFLGLKTGQLYIDHLRTIFENDLLFGTVCEQSIKKTQAKFEFHTLTRGDQSKWNQLFVKIFLGDEEVSFKSILGVSVDNVTTYFKKELLNQYCSQYKKFQSLNTDNIALLIERLGIEHRFDAVEVIRTLMLQKYYFINEEKSSKNVWDAYISSLSNSDVHEKYVSIPSIDNVFLMMEDIISKYNFNFERLQKEIKLWYIKIHRKGDIGGYKTLKQHINRIIDAGTSLFVAYTGYRKSEYSFPLSSISSTINLDILDNSYVPFRYHLKWIIPKTNGGTKLNREITSQCYQIALQLSEIIGKENKIPCLYSTVNFEIKKNSSVKAISRSVVSNWNDFVKNYNIFVELEKLQDLNKKTYSNLSKKEITLHSILESKYDFSSKEVINLIKIKDELKNDLPILECTHAISTSNNKNVGFKESLNEFKSNGFSKNLFHNNLIKKVLSDDTRRWLLSENQLLKKSDMRKINQELLNNRKYPSPHAFRHIWAESVLSRYQGDVGAVIRHQFCHLDNSFFMAYLRNKDASTLLDAARVTILNSMVDTLLLEAENSNPEAVGGFANFVKKAALMTHIVDSNKARELRERIKGRIISMQTLPFATCLPREGCESRAKCAEFGEVQPHNARPSFCLNCINSLITSGNIKGIWMTISPFVKECMNDDIPIFVVEDHLPTIKSAYKRIKELQTPKNHVKVQKILDTLSLAISKTENRLAEENVKYG